jgi:3-mercaptopyruvate sulfurtransferase SseA
MVACLHVKQLISLSMITTQAYLQPIVRILTFEWHQLKSEVNSSYRYLTVLAANLSIISDYSQIVSNSLTSLDASKSAELVLDARSQGRWAGTEPEPRPNMASGHIPHSLSLPFNKLLENNTLPGKNIQYTTLLDEDRLGEVLKATLGDAYFKQIKEGGRSVVNTCGSGMSAAIIWLALQVIGVQSAIYDEVGSHRLGQVPHQLTDLRIVMVWIRRAKWKSN